MHSGMGFTLKKEYNSSTCCGIDVGSEVSQTQKDNRVIPLTGTENGIEITRASGSGGMGSSCIMGTVSVCGDGKFWKWIMGMVVQHCDILNTTKLCF